MKLTKKGIWAIVGTSLVAVSAIVVPTSIAFSTSQTAVTSPTTNGPPATESGPADGGGAPTVTSAPGNPGSQPAPTATEAEVNEDSADYSQNSAKNLTFPWGDPRRFPAPPLDFPGYRAALYDAGTYDSERSDFDRLTTQLGNSKAVFSFTYLPLNQGEKLLRVKYGVNVVKGSTEPLLGFFTRKAEPFAYGTETAPTLAGGFDNWAFDHGYGFKKDPSAVLNPAYFDEQGNAITAQEIKTMAVGSRFRAQYQAIVDTPHYHDEGIGSAATPSFTYIVSKRKLASVADKPAGRPTNYLTEGATFAMPTKDDLPADAQADFYRLKSEVPQTFVTGLSSFADSGVPALGAPINPANVKDYQAGTSFDVVFSYVPVNDNVYGNNYDYVFRYEIAAPTAGAPASGTTELPELTRSFGQLSEATTQAPAFNGYEHSSTSAVVTKASAITNGSSPAVGTVVDWSSVNSYNPGTEFVVTYAYAPSAGTSGAGLTITQKYQIVARTVDPVTNLVAPAENTTDYVYGQDPANMSPAQPERSYYKLSGVKYYVPDPDEGFFKEAEAGEIRTLHGQERFVAVWTFAADPERYVALSNDPADLSYTLTTTYVVQPQLAYYEGPLAYADVEIRQGEQPPADFARTEWNLPEPGRNYGYAFDTVATLFYYIKTAASDGSSPAVDQRAFLDQISTYGAGTVVVASVSFSPQHPDYRGDVLVVEKTLTIKAR